MPSRIPEKLKEKSTEDDSQSSELSASQSDDEQQQKLQTTDQRLTDDLSSDDEEEEEESNNITSASNSPQKISQPKLTTTKSILTSNAPPKRPSPKTGVVYLSRLPPGMDVTALRALLSRTGSLGRIWLRPKGNDSTRRAASFRDGWIEYKQRKDARKVVGLLNGQTMVSAKRPGRWRDDLWCMKFLSDFAWEDLSAEVFGVARERTLKVREQVAAARTEKAWVEKRMAMANKIRKGDDKKRVRNFKQRSVIPASHFDEDEDEKRAREASERVDHDVDQDVQREVDQDLIEKLFKKRRKV